MVLLGKKIKDLRKSNKLTQRELAAKVGVTKSTIAAYENDSRMPSYDILIKLAGVFHVTTDSFLSGTMETVIRAQGLTEEQIDILDTMIESFKASNLLRGAVMSGAAIADVIAEYRRGAEQKKTDFSSGKTVSEKEEIKIDKEIKM